MVSQRDLQTSLNQEKSTWGYVLVVKFLCNTPKYFPNTLKSFEGQKNQRICLEMVTTQRSFWVFTSDVLTPQSPHEPRPFLANAPGRPSASNQCPSSNINTLTYTRGLGSKKGPSKKLGGWVYFLPFTNRGLHWKVQWDCKVKSKETQTVQIVRDRTALNFIHVIHVILVADQKL